MALVLTLIFSFFKLGSGQWQVIGPDTSIHVSMGADAAFSCYLLPETSAEAMEVLFFRDDFSNIVHLYRDGIDQDDFTMKEYQGRTEFIKKSIADGHVSLRLKKVTALDAGVYGCRFSSQRYEQEVTWELKVSMLGSVPLVSILGYAGEKIQLLCKSSGWVLKPTLKWKDSEGRELSSEFKVNTDAQNLIDVESSFTVHKNFGSFSCSIQLPEQGQEVESRVQIGETFFKDYYLTSILFGILCPIMCFFIFILSRSVKKHIDKLLQELNWKRKNVEAEIKKFKKYTVEVTLDPDTAHPNLCIFDKKSVIYKDALQNLPHSEKRFSSESVVASQGFQGGKYYWEVEVGHNVGWNLGVCRDNVNRKKLLKLSPGNGYWVFGKKDTKDKPPKYFTYIPFYTPLSLRNPLTRVGVFLDYEDGTISFFNIKDKSLIITLTHQYKGLLRPFIHYNPKNKKKVTPIVICPESTPQRKKCFLQYFLPTQT